MKNVPTLFVASRLLLDDRTLLSPGALAVVEGAVAAAGPPADVERGMPPGFRRVDLPGLAVFPGLVNAHTHLSIPPLPGLDGAPASKSLSFVDWILRVIDWRRSAPPGEFGKNVENAAREAVASGTTSVGEIAGPDPGAYAEFPLRARVFAEGVGFFPEVADAVHSLVEATVQEIQECGGTVAPGVSPHTLYTVGEPLLRRLGELAMRLDLPAALHLAESPEEMEFLSRGTGAISGRLYPAVGREVSFFRGLGAPIPSVLRGAALLRDGLILVHNVHLSRPEIDELNAGGARFVLCPRSNASHRNGSPDVTHFIDAGIPLSLGTDSLGSVGTLDMWEEMRTAAALYRGRLPGKELSRALFRAATGNGARALRLPSGTLAPGAPADFAALFDPGGEDAGTLIHRLLDRAQGKDVRMTVVAGDAKHERP